MLLKILNQTKYSCLVVIMILKRLTLKKFHYKISDLKLNSCKLVVWECDKCGIIEDKIFRYAKKYCKCLTCSNRITAHKFRKERSQSLKLWHLRHSHPLLGTKRPQHVKDALLKSHIGIPLSESTKLKISKKTKGKFNPFYNKRHSKKSLRKMSLIQQMIARTGKECNFYGKTYPSKHSIYVDRSGRSNKMKSSWEVKFAKYLDKKKRQWSYESKHFDLILNNKEVSYTPDFYINKENMYIEIKGYWRKDAKQKFIAFKKQYPNINIKLLKEKDLKRKGIL